MQNVQMKGTSFRKGRFVVDLHRQNFYLGLHDRAGMLSRPTKTEGYCLTLATACLLSALASSALFRGKGLHLNGCGSISYLQNRHSIVSIYSRFLLS